MQKSAKFIQGGALLVMNELITSINWPCKRFNWGYKPTYRSYNTAYNW